MRFCALSPIVGLGIIIDVVVVCLYRIPGLFEYTLGDPLSPLCITDFSGKQIPHP